MRSGNDAVAASFHNELLRRFGWLTRVRPMLIGALGVRLLAPLERRRIVDTEMGVRLYVDPLSHGGHEITVSGMYEGETFRVLMQELKANDVALDIGANEGIFTAVMAQRVGSGGMVIAIEPQSKLRDIIEINLRINGAARYRVYSRAFGGAEDASTELNVFPALNSGASSLVRRYRFSATRETVRFVSPETLLKEAGVSHFDFVKVDVEGFEHRVVEALLPLIRRGGVRKLLLDYHASILAAHGVAPEAIHASLLEAGMHARGEPATLSAYVLYEFGASSGKSSPRPSASTWLDAD